MSVELTTENVVVFQTPLSPIVPAYRPGCHPATSVPTKLGLFGQIQVPDRLIDLCSGGLAGRICAFVIPAGSPGRFERTPWVTFHNGNVLHDTRWISDPEMVERLAGRFAALDVFWTILPDTLKQYPKLGGQIPLELIDFSSRYLNFLQAEEFTAKAGKYLDNNFGIDWDNFLSGLADKTHLKTQDEITRIIRQSFPNR